MTRTDPSPDEHGSFAYTGLDRVLHEKARLGILTALLTHHDGLSFAQLKQLCSLTDGNLSRHLQVLQDAGLARAKKGHDGKRPLTTVELTGAGRHQFLAYLQELERVIADARTHPERRAHGAGDLPRGLAPS